MDEDQNPNQNFLMQLEAMQSTLNPTTVPTTYDIKHLSVSGAIHLFNYGERKKPVTPAEFTAMAEAIEAFFGKT